MTLMKSPVARATMLIRRPVEEVFNAFVDPTVTTRFWFSRSSGQLAPGKTVTWYWDQYGVSGEVTVTALEKNQRKLGSDSNFRALAIEQRACCARRRPYSKNPFHAEPTRASSSFYQSITPENAAA